MFVRWNTLDGTVFFYIVEISTTGKVAEKIRQGSIGSGGLGGRS